ncbi:hypothetical protein BDZ45DRAFT_741132 [Acephala macrosclerotiorum]|nr:hypothetical protein BDZ45DRAFT_741132 [Acephala macrosclerotiorum]
MATRNRHGKSDRADGYTWSEWELDERNGKYYRFRYNSKGTQVWDSYEPQASSAASASVPRGDTAVAEFSNSSSSNNSDYYENASYQYNSQTREYDLVDGLAQGMAHTTLTERPGTIAEADYYDEGGQGTQDALGYREGYQPTQTVGATDAYGSSSVATPMYSTSGTIASYTAMTGGSFTATPMSTGYGQPGPSNTYYNQEVAEKEEDTGDSPPYLGQSFDSAVTVTQATYHHSSRRRSDPPDLKPPAPFRLRNDLSISRKDVHKKIEATDGKYEKLDPGFRVHHSKSFQPGQIFKVVWAEPAGETSKSETSSVTEVTGESWTVQKGEYGEKVYSTVRRFVVVATGKGHSNCVPILTYGRQGLAKRGIHPEDHAYIYAGTEPPEEGREHDNVSIQMQSKTPRDKLAPMSVINYAKIYPVEHNVKVQFIGWIAKSSQRHFVRDFEYVWQTQKQMSR